jgi:hypothetical protein
MIQPDSKESHCYDKPRPEYLEMMERLKSKILATPEEVAELKGTYSTN